MTEEKNFDVTIVIPAFNEEKYLASCLDSLVNQKTNLKYEVIVVDNNSTDRTAKIASSFKNRMNIRVIFEKKQGRAPEQKILMLQHLRLKWLLLYNSL